MNSSSTRLALSAGCLVMGAAPFVGLGHVAPKPRSSNAVFARGLEAWRRPGNVANAACADCHGPDGLELAIYNFDDADIRRRAMPHLGKAGADQVVELIHEVRKRQGLTRLLDPDNDRPFQPGGAPLPGETAEARDVAFGRELESRIPLLTTGRIESLDQAKAAAAQIMAVDPWTLKIGVPFNRFSEDVFHGKEHASLAHWIPDVPRVLPAENRAEWYRLQDAYLADPSEENLWQMYSAFDRLTKPESNQAIADVAADKYRSLLLLQHLARTGQFQYSSPRPPIYFGRLSTPMIPSPMWQVGDWGRMFQDRSAESMGLDADLAQKKSGGPSFQQQMRELQASWFWIGWLFDQGLHRTSFRQAIARGDWMAVALWNAGPYPIHNAYWIARKQLVSNLVPDAWVGPGDRKRPEWDYLAMRIGGGYELNMPKDPVHRAMFERITANAFRMSLFLMLDEWRRTKIVWYRDYTKDQLRPLVDFIERHDSTWKPQAEALRAEALAAVAACTEKSNMSTGRP